MKRTLLTLLLVAFLVPTISCGDLMKKLGGQKEEISSDEGAKSAPADDKIKVLEDKIQKLEADAKAKEEAEKKAKEEAALKAKLKEEVRQELLEEQKKETEEAAEEKKEEATKEKVVEKVIIKEKAATPAAPAQPAKPKGWVRLYDLRGFGGPSVTIPLGKNIPDLNFVARSDGRDANDMCASLQYDIPPGWSVVIYHHPNYQGQFLTAGGKGGRNITDKLNDQCSAVRWVKN